MKQKKVIFWDFDGVIADSSDFVYQYWRKAIEEKGHDFKFKNFQEIFAGEHSWAEIANYGVKPECKDLYSAYERTHYPCQVKIFPEIYDILERFSQDHTYIIMSANQVSVIEATLEKNDLAKYFTEIYGRDNNILGQAGTKALKMQKYLEINNLEKSDALLIGDTISDIREAQKAEIEVVAVEWGKIHDREFFQPFNPEYILSNFTELAELLQSLADKNPTT